MNELRTSLFCFYLNQNILKIKHHTIIVVKHVTEYVILNNTPGNFLNCWQRTFRRARKEYMRTRFNTWFITVRHHTQHLFNMKDHADVRQSDAVCLVNIYSADRNMCVCVFKLPADVPELRQWNMHRHVVYEEVFKGGIVCLFRLLCMCCVTSFVVLCLISHSVHKNRKYVVIQHIIYARQ